MDISNVDRWKPNERGVLQLTPTFDASSPAAQVHLKDACDRLASASCGAAGCEGGTLLRNGADARVICPMREFAKYQIALNRTFPTGKDVVFVGDVRVFTERQRQVSAKARRV